MNTEILDRPSTALTLPQRAAVAFGESANAAKLRELVAKSSGIVAVTNADGRDEAHRAGMVLLKTRTGIRATGKAARDDATKFSKAVIQMEDELIGIIEPEEARVLALRDAFDEQVAAEKAAKIAAERARVEKIRNAIDNIKGIPLRHTSAGSDLIFGEIEFLASRPVTIEYYAEFAGEAQIALDATLEKLREMRAAAIAAEQSARDAEQARIAEAARLEQERVENARVRAENERIANEQAAERKRLYDITTALELAARQHREQAEANLRAEREAQAKAVADLKAKQDAFAAQQAAFRAEQEATQQAELMRQKRDDDHTEALEMNAQFDAEADSERARIQQLAAEDLARCEETAKAMLTNGRSLALPESLSERDALMDAADVIGGEFYPTDAEIIDLFAEEFAMSTNETVARLRAFVVANEESTV